MMHELEAPSGGGEPKCLFSITGPEASVCDKCTFAAKNLSAQKVKVHDRWRLLIERIPKEQVIYHPFSLFHTIISLNITPQTMMRRHMHATNLNTWPWVMKEPLIYGRLQLFHVDWQSGKSEVKLRVFISNSDDAVSRLP